MARRVRLSLTNLEDRLAPAVSAVLSGGTLTLRGDHAANSLTLTATAANTLEVSANGKALGNYLVNAGVSIIMGNSSDSVRVSLGGFTFGGAVTADLGNSDDSFAVTAAGGGMNGPLTVRGGFGNDAVTVNAGVGAAAGLFAGRVSVDAGVGTDTVSLGNAAAVSQFGGAVSVTAANVVQWSTSQNDVYASDVSFNQTGDAAPLTLQEGDVGGSNVITVGGAVRLLGGAGAETIFLRGMNVAGPVLAALAGGANDFNLSSSAATVTEIAGGLSYLGGTGAEDLDLRGGVVHGSVSLTTGDGDDVVQLASFGGSPTVIGGDLTVTTGNGNVTFGDITAQIAGNVNLNLGNGNSTVTFADGGSVGGRISVRGGGGSTTLRLTGAQSYLVYAQLGAGDDAVELNNAAATLSGVIDGGTGTNSFLHTAGTLGPNLTQYGF
jgi:hypothetical protein